MWERKGTKCKQGGLTDIVLATCYEGGQFLGECCAGFCAANKCRPWVNPTA